MTQLNQRGRHFGAPPTPQASNQPSSILRSLDEPIAVIGFSLRFPPDVNSSKAFWQMLVNSESGRCEVPPDRFNIDSFYHPNPAKAGAVRDL
jgi:hypothetical protein